MKLLCLKGRSALDRLTWLASLSPLSNLFHHSKRPRRKHSPNKRFWDCERPVHPVQYIDYITTVTGCAFTSMLLPYALSPQMLNMAEQSGLSIAQMHSTDPDSELMQGNYWH